MAKVKELWFAEMERLMGEYIDQGMSEEEAYEKASENAYEEVIDKVAAQADHYRMLQKEGHFDGKRNSKG